MNVIRPWPLNELVYWSILNAGDLQSVRCQGSGRLYPLKSSSSKRKQVVLFLEFYDNFKIDAIRVITSLTN